MLSDSNKKLLTISSVTLAIISFFAIPNTNNVEVVTKDISNFNNKTNNITNNANQKIDRSTTAKIIAYIGFVLSLIFKTISFIFTTLFKLSVNPIFNIFIDSICIFIVLLTLFLILYKMIFPYKSIKELLTLKNILIMYLASLLISIILNSFDEVKTFRIILIIIKCLASLLIIFYLYKYLMQSKYQLFKVKDKKLILIVSLSIILSSIVKIIFINNNILNKFSNIICLVLLILPIALLIIKRRKTKIVSFQVEVPNID